MANPTKRRVAVCMVSFLRDHIDPRTGECNMTALAEETFSHFFPDSDIEPSEMFFEMAHEIVGKRKWDAMVDAIPIATIEASCSVEAEREARKRLAGSKNGIKWALQGRIIKERE